MSDHEKRADEELLHPQEHHEKHHDEHQKEDFASGDLLVDIGGGDSGVSSSPEHQQHHPQHVDDVDLMPSSTSDDAHEKVKRDEQEEEEQRQSPHHYESDERRNSTSDHNGFVVVDENDHHHHNHHHHQQQNAHQTTSSSSGASSSHESPVKSSAAAVAAPAPATTMSQDEISKMLEEFASPPSQPPKEEPKTMPSAPPAPVIEQQLPLKPVKAEADSTTHLVEPSPAPIKKQQPVTAAAAAPSTSSTSSSSSCVICPYYKLVEDLLLWKNPIKTGVSFSVSLALLISLTLYSFLSVISCIMLLVMTGFGAFRLYLNLMYRIKGTHDQTFGKLTTQDIELPKEKLNELTRLIENDINKFLNSVKGLVLWESIITSGFAFIGCYVLYSLGFYFNTLTLAIIFLVFAFTVPKVYHVYKKEIDHALDHATSFIHVHVKQIIQKMPPQVRGLFGKSGSNKKHE